GVSAGNVDGDGGGGRETGDAHAATDMERRHDGDDDARARADAGDVRDDRRAAGEGREAGDRACPARSRTHARRVRHGRRGPRRTGGGAMNLRITGTLLITLASSALAIDVQAQCQQRAVLAPLTLTDLAQ